MLHNNAFVENLCRREKNELRLHVKCPMQHPNKRLFVCSWPSLDLHFAEQIVMTYKSLRSFSFFVSIAVKLVTRFEGIIQVCNSIRYHGYVCLYSCHIYPVNKSHLCCATLRFHLCPVWLPYIFQHHFINGTDFGKGY